MGVLFQYTRTYFRLPILIFLSSETNMKQWRIKILKLKKILKKKGGGLYSVKLENEKNFLVKKNQQIYINSLFQNFFFFNFDFKLHVYIVFCLIYCSQLTVVAWYISIILAPTFHLLLDILINSPPQFWAPSNTLLNPEKYSGLIIESSIFKWNFKKNAINHAN